MTTRPLIADARRIVVKIGSAVLTAGGPTLDRAYLHDLAFHVSSAQASGRRLIIVSSGAVAAGLAPLAMTTRPRDVAGQQAAAAAGQPLLMKLWAEAFAVRSLPVAQLLLTREDFDSRQRFLNIRNAVARLWELGAVPIVNENDTVATDEISLGDNDLLSARIAAAARADALIILTSAPGVLDSSDRVVTESHSVDALIPLVRAHHSAQGRGGMASKLAAARAASLSGIPTLIAPGRPHDNLAALCAGEPLGTLITPPPEGRVAGRRLWIALAATPAGALTIDPGAVKALRERGASLLARGITAVEGRFNIGDTVLIRDHHHAEVARGLTNYSSDELARILGADSERFESILGRQAHDEVIHRDNLAVL